MNKFFGHLKTVARHRRLVIKHGKKAGIWFSCLFHDLSKYSPAEFWVGVKYYTGTKSPNEGERLAKGYSAAWLHHKGRNRHHFEYWNDYNPQFKKVMPVKMPLKYCAEMFCDRLAASKVYQGKNYTDSHPLLYFLRGKQRRDIHPETSEQLELWLTILAEKGEEAAFKEIRRCLKEDKKNVKKRGG